MQTNSPEELSYMGLKTAPNSQELGRIVPPSPSSDSSSSCSHLEDETSTGIGIGAGTEDDLEKPNDSNKDVFVEDISFSDFKSQHIADLASLVSIVFSETVRQNDQVPFSSDKLTRFHSRAPPQISVRDYIFRVIKFCKLDKAVLLVSIYLADLFSASYANFTLNSLTVHRFLITAFTVAAKGLCDQFCSNTLYARVGGIKVMELNLLEVEFLVRVNYRIVPPRHELSHCYSQVLAKRVDPAFKSVVAADSLKQTHGLQAQTSISSTQTANSPEKELSPSTELLKQNRKHPRDTSVSDSEPTETNGLPKPPGRSTGNKGLKAVKDTFRFLQGSKKKRNEIS